VSARRAVALAAPLVVTAALLTAPAADAAAPTNRPFNALLGKAPHVAVAPDGTGYVVAVQYSSPGVDGVLRLCVIPRGARKCVLTRAFTPDLASGEFLATKPYVFAPSATEVDVAAYESNGATDELKFWRSTNRGVTFDGGTTIGTVNPAGDLVRGPGASLTGVNDVQTGGTDLQNAPLDGSLATARPVKPTTNEDATALAVLADGSVLLASSSSESCPCGLTVQRAAPGANLNAAASWTTVAVHADGTDARLATGPSGTYLLTHVPVAGTWQVQKYNPAAQAFGAPVRITRSDDDNRMALRESGNGWVYALIQGNYAGSGRPLQLFRSHDGVHWSKPLTLAAFGSAYDNEFDVANDGGGFAVQDQLDETKAVTVVPIPVLRAIAGKPAGAHVAGRVMPGKLHQPVQLQVLHAKKWVTVKTTSINAAGKFLLPKPKAKGTYRVIAPAVEGYAEADAAPFKL
jgi:hypothetical protein